MILFGQEEVRYIMTGERRRNSIRSGKTGAHGQVGSSCSSDFEALGRVAPATSISELSVCFLRKCKEHCCVLGSPCKFFGNDGRGKGIVRSRYTANTCM